MFQNTKKGNLLDRRFLLKSAGAFLGMSGIFKRVPMTSPQQNPPGKQPANSGSKRTIGFMLAHEQFTSLQLIEFGTAAEQAGFDFLATSDHLQPWQTNEGHAGMCWLTMSALGQKTTRIHMGTTVTCPTFRYNPAVVAQAFASLSLLYPGRIFLGLGSGEAINEETAANAFSAEFAGFASFRPSIGLFSALCDVWRLNGALI